MIYNVAITSIYCAYTESLFFLSKCNKLYAALIIKKTEKAILPLFIRSCKRGFG